MKYKGRWREIPLYATRRDFGNHQKYGNKGHIGFLELGKIIKGQVRTPASSDPSPLWSEWSELLGKWYDLHHKLRESYKRKKDHNCKSTLNKRLERVTEAVVKLREEGVSGMGGQRIPILPDFSERTPLNVDATGSPLIPAPNRRVMVVSTADAIEPLPIRLKSILN